MKELKAKDFRKINEPVLIKIKKNQYKIDLGGKSYFEKVVLIYFANFSLKSLRILYSAK